MIGQAHGQLIDTVGIEVTVINCGEKRERERKTEVATNEL